MIRWLRNPNVHGSDRHGAADRLVRAFAGLGVIAIVAGLVALLVQAVV